METELITKLGDILSPIRISGLAAETVARVAGESDESRATRKRLDNQLDVLVQGLETCKKFVTGTSHSMSPRPFLRFDEVEVEANKSWR